MDKWEGSAAVCVMNGKMLMVKQGKPEEQKKWAVPSGGRKQGESFEECCIREVFEETGYQIKILRPLHEKVGNTFGIDVSVHYFEVQIIGGQPTLQDPDGLIYEISWKSAEDLETLDLGFPEDRDFLIDFLNEKVDYSF